VPEQHPWRFVLLVEEVELAAQVAVIAPLGLRDAVQVGVEVGLLRPCRAIDTLQHLVARITSPVRPGEPRQLEYLEPARRRHVRPAAEIGEAPLAVERDRLAGRNRSDDLRLVVLADRLEVTHRVIARHDRAHHRLVEAREFGHLVFDRREILGRERPLVGEVVVEPVLDDRADCDLRIGKELLDRIGEQVRRGMAQDLEALRILVGDNRQLDVAIDNVGRIDQLAVDLGRERVPGQAGADGSGDLSS